MSWISKILISSLSLMMTAFIIPGAEISNYYTGVIVAIVLSLLNTFLKPLLIIFTIPATVLSLGLFLLVINSMIILLASNFVDGFWVSGFWSALFFSVILSAITACLEAVDAKYERP